MEALVLGQDFETVSILDFFESFIWTDRYYEAGDCEIYAPASIELISALQEKNYIWRKDSEHVMVITSVALDSDIEEGVHLTVKGESLEALLKRRVIWETILEGNVQNGIQKLLEENVIDPLSKNRKIENFKFIPSTDKRITALEFEASLHYAGEDLYESIVEICMAFDLGFKVTLNEKTYDFEFRLYMGQDRSYNQDLNPWVVFSPKYDNLSASSYYSSSEDYRNAVYILAAPRPEEGVRLGDNPPYDPPPPEPKNNGMSRYTEVEKEDAVGLDRREIFLDKSDVDDEEETKVRRLVDHVNNRPVFEWEDALISMSDEDYLPPLEEEARLSLAEYQVTTAFEGQIEASQQYTYGKDFFMGDIVQVVNEFDMEAHSRISEIIRCYDVNGDTLTPTFINVPNNK